MITSVFEIGSAPSARDDSKDAANDDSLNTRRFRNGSRDVGIHSQWLPRLINVRGHIKHANVEIRALMLGGRYEHRSRHGAEQEGAGSLTGMAQ